MKKSIFLACCLFMAATGAFCQAKAGKTPDTKRTVEYYTCKMHPDVVSNKPGNCPKCNMKLNFSRKELLKQDELKNYVCPDHADVVFHNAGQCPKCGKQLNLSLKEQRNAEATKAYTCPMHPGVALDKNGKCPKCAKG